MLFCRVCLFICHYVAYGGRIHGRIQAQTLQSNVAEPKFDCPKGMHLQLDKSMSDHHVVNPYADDDEEHHFVLSSGLRYSHSFSGPCSQLVVGPPAFESDAQEELWDPEMIEPLGWLDGSLEVRCMPSSQDRKARLEVVQYSCREHLPFSVVWAHDPTTEPEQSGKWARSKLLGGQFEYAEFACGDPFAQQGPDLLQNGAVRKLPLPRVHSLQEALAACEREEQCLAVAVHPNGQTVHMLDQFSCPLAPDVLSTTFDIGDKTKLALIVRQRPLDGKEESLEVNKLDEGTVLEKWSLDSQETHVLVQFTHGAERILPEHLQKTASLWTVIRKVRARQVVCNDLQEDTSCDVYSKQQAEVLLHGPSLTPASCQQACSAHMKDSFLLSGCCVLAEGPGLCALTRGEHFKASYDEEEKPVELAGACKQVPCSLDPHCTFGTGDFGVHVDHLADDGGSMTTLYFDFAHPLTLPFFLDMHNLKVFHFTSRDKHALKGRRASKLIRSIGSVTGGAATAHRVNLSLDVSRLKNVHAVYSQLSLVCDALGHKMGRLLQAPNLQEAITSGECDEPQSETLENCLIKVGCGALGDFQPFAPPWFAQLPFDLVAWQAPAAFCCGRPYTIDQRKESWMKTLLESAGIPTVSIESVDDADAHQSMQASLQSGSLALKKMLSHHIEDEEMLNWFGELIRAALKEFKKILTDLKEAIDSEGPELEISSDGASFLQVHEDGDQLTPSGRRGTEVARWSSERGAFIQVDPKTNATGLQKTWNLIAAVPGAIFNYGLRPLWNFVASPLLKWGMSLMKWVLEHPRAALFISKFALAVRNRMCEKASWYVYGDSTESSVGAFAKLSESVSASRPQLKCKKSPVIVNACLGMSTLPPGRHEMTF